jgi:hypothetical protein
MAMFESIGMPSKSILQNDRALIVDGMGNTGMHGRRRHVADARVTMFVVVPGKERLAKRTRFFDRLEPGRKVGPVFHGLEQRFRERDMWRPKICCVRAGKPGSIEQILACSPHICIWRFSAKSPGEMSSMMATHVCSTA